MLRGVVRYCRAIDVRLSPLSTRWLRKVGSAVGVGRTNDGEGDGVIGAATADADGDATAAGGVRRSSPGSTTARATSVTRTTTSKAARRAVWYSGRLRRGSGSQPSM